MYGDADGYPDGKAYFDGVADESDDLAGRMIFKEADRDDIRLSDVVSRPSPQRKCERYSTLTCRRPPPWAAAAARLFETIVPADPTPTTHHDVRRSRAAAGHAIRHADLGPPSRAERPAVLVTSVTTAGTLGEFKGVVRSDERVQSPARVSLDESATAVRTDKAGAFALIFVPTGSHVLRAETDRGRNGSPRGEHQSRCREEVDITLPANRNLIAGDGKDLMAGWTRFGDFDGQWKNSQFSVPAHLGSDWIGSVAGGVGGKKGGVHRTVRTVPGNAVPVRRLGSDRRVRPGRGPTGRAGDRPHRCRSDRWNRSQGPRRHLGQVPMHGQHLEGPGCLLHGRAEPRPTLFAQHKFEDYYVLARGGSRLSAICIPVEDRPTTATNEQRP